MHATYQHIIIVSHELYYGAAQALRDYLLGKKIRYLLFISLPFYVQRNAKVYKYHNGKEVEKKIYKRNISFGILDYCIDFLLTFWWVWRERELHDLFIGAGTLDCFVGVVLKKLKKVKRVIFYSIDFTPIRFRNPLLNNIYHMIEILCVKYADKVWNVSPRIAQGRKKFLRISRSYKQKVVPIGVWNEKVKKTPFDQIKKHQLVFAGHLLEKQGVQLVLNAIPSIIKKISDFTFLIVGGGEYEEELKKITKRLEIEKHVVFTGWIQDKDKINGMLSKSACAIAPYKPEEKQLFNFTYYADPTKVKDYLSVGLPVILTNVPYNARDLVRKKCGVVVEYDKDKIAQAVTSLMKNDALLKQYRENALRYAKDFDWNVIFSDVL